MKYTTKAAEKSTMKITMKFDADEWKDALNKAYVKTKGRYSVNGFRKGKAPRNVIEHAYGKGVFFEDALNVLFSENYGTVLDKEEKKFTAVGDPELSVDDLSDDGVTLVAVTPVRPEVKIGSYKGMKIKEFAYNVEDADVDKEIERLLDRNARKTEVSDRPCQNGDTVNIDFVGTIDGVKFDGGEAAGFDLTLGSGQFIPGFEDQVVGMNVGEEKDISVKFPEDYHAENLKGKDAVFHIVLHEIKKKELPEITDEFVKDADGAESVEAFKAETRKRMQESNDRRAQRELEDNIVKTITDKAETEIPDALVESQIDRMVQEMEYRLMYQGLRLEDYLKYSKMSLEDYRKGYEPQAREIVKQQLVIDKIISDEKIEAGEEELEKKIAENAAAQNKSAEEYKKENESRTDYLKNEIVIEKLFDFLKNANTIE